jgi:2-oxoisovalerate dehydrogenase E1 component beta subunit
VTSWTMSAALNRALHDAMAVDDRVVLLGEDIGVSGGVFRVTDGLLDSYGNRRVFDTPISEAGIVGAAVGLCFAGWRPVVELQFDAFSYPAFEQIVDHVAKMRMRTRGRIDMPITLRIPAFGGIKGKEHHGESPEVYFAHTAGLKVAVPSSPLDAYALLRHAIEDPDPVIVLEPKAHYWSKEEGEIATDQLPLGTGRILRDGADVTLIAYGSTVARVRDAAEQLSHAGIGARIADLRWLSPLDDDLLQRCAVETGRLVVVHEAPRHVGFGAEIAARAMELAFDSLAAPVARVTGWDVPYPPASLEDRYLPSVERIVAAAKETVAY